MSVIEDLDCCSLLYDCDIEGDRAKIDYYSTTGALRRSVVWIDPHTKDCYRDHSPGSLSFKCFAIFIANPVYTIGTFFWQVARLPVYLHWIVEDNYEYLCEKHTITRTIDVCTDMAIRIPVCLIRTVTNIAKTILCGALIQVFSALGAVWLPFFSRVQIARIEEFWHGGGKSQDFRHSSQVESLSEYVSNAFWGKESNRAIFIAYCFQRVRNLDRDQINHLHLLQSNTRVLVRLVEEIGRSSDLKKIYLSK